MFLQLNEQGLNVALYWKNADPRKYVNVVPTSAITGEGIPDLLQARRLQAMCLKISACRRPVSQPEMEPRRGRTAAARVCSSSRAPCSCS